MRAWLVIALIAAVVGSAFVVSSLMDPGPAEDGEEKSSEIRRPRRAPPVVRDRVERAPPAPPPEDPEPPPAEEETAAKSEAPPGLQEALSLDSQDALRRLLSLLQSKESTNEELLEALDEIGRVYEHPTVREHAEFRSRIEKALRKALTLVKTQRGDRTNQRDGVNLRAAEVLVATANPEVSKILKRAMERDFLRAKRYEPSPKLMATVLDGLARLNESSSLDWMTETFVHAERQRSARRGESVRTDGRAQAFASMRGFREVPGEARYRTVREMIKTFAGVESVARSGERGMQASRAEALWNEIGEEAMKTARHFAREPVGDDGKALATMADLQDWFREHEDPRAAPWTD